MAEHADKSNSISGSEPVDAEIVYGVSGGSGGPWTMTSDGKAPFIWTGHEDAGEPLRKALGIEIETDQEGGSIEGSGERRSMCRRWTAKRPSRRPEQAPYRSSIRR